MFFAIISSTAFTHIHSQASMKRYESLLTSFASRINAIHQSLAGDAALLSSSVESDALARIQCQVDSAPPSPLRICSRTLQITTRCTASFTGLCFFLRLARQTSTFYLTLNLCTSAFSFSLHLFHFIQSLVSANLIKSKLRPKLTNLPHTTPLPQL